MTEISEQELEDFICEHPEELWRELEIIGRQVKLEHGILDVLAWNYGRTYVIELKARPLKEKDIGQVLRYAYDVNSTLNIIGMYDSPVYPGKDRHLTIKESLFFDEWSHYTNLALRCADDPAVIPVLVGKDIDKRTLCATHAAKIQVYLWEHDASTSSFSFQGTNPVNLMLYNPPYPNWALNIKDRILRLAVETAKDEFEIEVKHLFGLIGKD